MGISVPLVLVPVLLAAFMVLDRLVRLEYSSHRPSWELDGRPRGMLWIPPEGNLLRGSLALLRLSWSWLFRTPGWMRQDKGALRLVWWMRILVLVWNLGVVATAVAAFSR